MCIRDRTKAERKEARLRKGKQWLLTYTGSPKKMNKHYRERFHVDAVTAAIGVRIPQCFFRMASGKCCSYMSIDFAVRPVSYTHLFRQLPAHVLLR